MEGADDLMAGVRERNAAAFERLYEHYGRLVFAIGMRMLGDAAAAEDVTQAVFLKIWSDPHSFRGGNFLGWIGRVTRNRCLDTLRTRAHNNADIIAETSTEESLTENNALADLDAQSVRAAIALLPAEQREAIELGFYGGITQEEIARRTGAPLGTVKSRIRAGLARLRASLSETVRE